MRKENFEKLSHKSPLLPVYCLPRGGVEMESGGEVIWRVELFGSLRALGDGRTIERFRTRRIALLLALLAMDPGAPLSRDVLAERLWPDEDPVRQRAKLRYSLSVLRQHLGAAAIETVGNDLVALHPGSGSDLAEFREALRSAGRTNDEPSRTAFLQRALALAERPFLDGFYDVWVLAERDACEERLFGEVLLPLLSHYENLGRNVEAAALRRTLAERFPTRTVPALLPAPPDADRALFGRERECENLQRWACEPTKFPILTLTGIGGIGKTRLVREALGARAQAFVSLASLTEPSECYRAIREALALPPRAGRPDFERVAEALRVYDAPLLLLDNADAIATTLAPALDVLLDACPRLRLVVTSRRRLGSARESELPLSPLPIGAARQLFLARARRYRPNLADNPVGAIDEICRLLEGIPLALEIAAARALHVPLPEMLRQLARRLRFLTTQARAGESAERSVQDVLKWSYEQLSDEAQRCFRELSVFSGGASLDAAQAVCGDTPPILDLLEELVVYGLLRPEVGDETTRYDTLAVVHELAASSLSAEERRLARERHADYFLLLARDLGARGRAGEWSALTAALLLERGNIAALVAFAVEAGRAALLRDLVLSLGAALVEIGMWTELEALLNAAEELLTPDNDPDGFATVATYRAVLARRRGDGPTAQRAWESLLAHFERRGETVRAGRTRVELAAQHIDEGRMADAEKAMGSLRSDATQDALTLATLETRLALADDSLERATELADRALNLLETDEKIAPRAWLSTAQYLSPVYRRAERWESHGYLVDGGVARAWECRQTFTLGVLLLEKAHLAARRAEPLEQVKALHAAHQIHRRLASRLVAESARRLDDALEAVGHLPEVVAWLAAAPANEMPTLDAYNVSERK